MYSNNIVSFQESTTILNACTKKVWKLIEGTIYIYIYIYTYIYVYVYIEQTATSSQLAVKKWGDMENIYFLLCFFFIQGFLKKTDYLLIKEFNKIIWKEL